MIKQNKKPPSLIKAILEGMPTTLPARGYKRIHASDLTKDDWCARRVCLVRKHQTELPPERFDRATQLTFSMGYTIADLFIHRWAKKWVIGDWACPSCNHRITWSKFPKSACKCGVNHWQYKEVNFKDSRSGASGGIDCFFELEEGKYTPVELKIMSTEKFNDLLAPLAEHKLRTQLYLDIIDNSSHPQKSVINTKNAKVFYVSRGHGKKHLEFGIIPFKEFDVFPDKKAVKYLQVEAVKVKVWEDKGILPPRICSVEFCGMANKCPVSTECFKEK